MDLFGAISAVAAVPGAPAWARLWLVDLDDTHPDETILTTAERARAARFAFGHDRRRFTAARVALRALLAKEAGVDPQIELRISAEGKPYVPGARAPFFNISHSGRYALIAISHSEEIGVDIEVVRPLHDLEALADRHFSRNERRAWRDDSFIGAGPLRFLQGWTRKEACLKALGTGLAVATRTFEIVEADGEGRVTIPIGGARWTVRHVGIELGEGLVAAVARVECDNSGMLRTCGKLNCDKAPSFEIRK